MERKTLYTAIGRLERRENKCRRMSHPVIVVGKKEHMADVQEMILWTSLSWRILRPEELEAVFLQISAQLGNMAERPLAECIGRLMARGLIVSGSGETEYDALYDLLGSLLIVPTGSRLSGLLFKTISFCRLAMQEKVPLKTSGKLLRKDKRTEQERKVMGLVNQALLSTAEIIKCVENNISRLPNEESIMEHLYNDEETTNDNICYTAQISEACKPVTIAVANLYLRKQIILESA